MKKDLHPTDYRPVVFQDSNAKFAFLTRSTAKTDETIKWEDGKEYPLVKVHISSASHPFYTGEEKIVDVEGRVDRFKAKQAAAKDRRDKIANKAKKVAKKVEDRSTDGSEQIKRIGERPASDTQKKAKKPAKKPAVKAETKKPEAKAEPKPEAKEESKDANQ